MRLQHRVLLAQLPLLLVLLLMVLMGGATVQRIGDQGRDVMRENYRSVIAAQRMKESIERLDSAALFRLAGEQAQADALVAQHRAAFEAELAVEEGNVTEPGEAAVAASLRASWAAYKSLSDRFQEAPPEQARQLYFAELLPAFQAVKADANRVLDLNQDAMVRKSEDAAMRAEAARRAWFLWSGLGVGTTLLIGAVLSRRIAGPLREMAGTAARIGDGQLDVRLAPTRVEELDALATAFNDMADRLRLYRRAADNELSRAREAAQAAIESLADPVLVLTLQGQVRAANGAARRLLGVQPHAGPHDGRSMGGDAALVEAVDAARARVVAEGRPVLPTDFSGVVVAGQPEGEGAFLVHATPINDAVTGELVGVTVLLQDVTRLRHLDGLKQDLVNTVAHELRTPLTSLSMALHLALDERVSGPLPGPLLDLLTASRQDVARMRALVEDLLDLSRLQEGRIVLRREPVGAAVLLAGSVEAMGAAALRRRVALQVEVDEGLVPIEVDRRRVQVALDNLTANAIRHTAEGSRVVLRALRVEGALRFEVDDAGPGVPPDERERIFEAFVGGTGEGTFGDSVGGPAEPGGGAGLGLYIAREVARAHGGRIGVTEAEGGGARFWIELPVG